MITGMKVGTLPQDTTAHSMIIKEHHEQLYASVIGTLDETDKFLQTKQQSSLKKIT